MTSLCYSHSSSEQGKAKLSWELVIFEMTKYYILIEITFCCNRWEETDPTAAVMCLGCWGRQCAWELHPCSISGLSSVLFVYPQFLFLFAFDSFSFLSLLPPCRVLLRTSCCLVITVWLSPSSLLFFCLAEVSCSLHSSAASSTSSCLSLLWFCITVVFLYLFVCFLGWSFEFYLLFVDLLSFLIARHSFPLARCALRHG